MMTSGLVVRFEGDGSALRDALTAPTTATHWTLGPSGPGCLALVLTAEGPRDSRQRTEWLRSLPGVLGAEPVYVSLGGWTAAPGNEQAGGADDVR